MTTTTAAKKTTAQAEPTTPVTETLAEVMESVTGYDEIGVEKNLGISIEDMTGAGEGEKTQAIKLTRALIAVHRCHQGDNPTKAWHFALSMRMSDVQNYFAPAAKDDDDVLTTEAQSESGKDES